MYMIVWTDENVYYAETVGDTDNFSPDITDASIFTHRTEAEDVLFQRGLYVDCEIKEV